MGPTINFVDQVEIGHISLNIDHIFQWGKAAITEAYMKRNQLQ